MLGGFPGRLFLPDLLDTNIGSPNPSGHRRDQVPLDRHHRWISQSRLHALRREAQTGTGTNGDHTRISRRVRRASIGAIEQSNAELLSQAAREHNAVLSASSAGSTTHNNQRCSAATAEKPPCETAPCCEGQQTEKDEQIRLACKDDTCSDARCDKLQGQEEDEEDEYIPVTALTPEARYETGRRLSACTELVT